MSMRRFHKYFNSQEKFVTKKKAIDNTNNEYIDAYGDNIFDPDEIEVKWDDICFIAGNENSLPKIYTHGEYYGGNTVSLDTAYTTYTHGLADALDVAYIIADNEEVVSYALAYHQDLINYAKSQINAKQDTLSYTSYIDITNNVITASYTTLATAYATSVDGLATAYDVATEMNKVEQTLGIVLNNHETRLNIIEDTNIVDGNFKLGDTIYLSCAYVNGDTIVCDKHVTYNEETETIIVNS